MVHQADDEEMTLSISYTELIPVLINAIKEQQQIIDTQSKNYTNLLERVAAIEANQTKKQLWKANLYFCLPYVSP